MDVAPYGKRKRARGHWRERMWCRAESKEPSLPGANFRKQTDFRQCSSLHSKHITVSLRSKREIEKAAETASAGMIARLKKCVQGVIRSRINGAFMNDGIAYKPLECLTMSDPGMLQRMAARYAEMVREHAYLVGLMDLAVRAGDSNLLTRTKKRLAETELECNECCRALRDIQREVLRASADEREGVAAVSETCEYATA